MNREDPRGLKPIIRLTSAILTSFAGSAFIGMTLVGTIVAEPEGWRMLRIVSGLAFAATIAWSIALYLRWLRERRDG